MDPPGQPNEAPVASFTADQQVGSAPLGVTFDAGASNDPDGSIESYAWSFGDGSTGSGVTVEHVYDEPGLHTPTLTVTDNRGTRAVLSGSAITVNSPPGSGSNTIQGVVWHDTDASRDRGQDEAGVPSIPVFLDVDEDGERDAGEQVVFTDATGAYTLSGVEDGSHSVTQDLPIGWSNTAAAKVGPAPGATRAAAAGVSPAPGSTAAAVAIGPSPSAAASILPAASPPQPVIGGAVADEGEFPFQVALVFETTADNEDAFTCGGTLIAASWVLTAAHCVDERPAPLQVLVGTQDLRTGGQRVDVVHTLIYPAFNTNAFVSNDIALLELDGSFMIPRVEVMTQPKLALANPGVGATAVGWGRTSTSGSISPDLKKLQIEIISNDACMSILADDVTEATICAGMSGQQEGLCSGDSGGPLLVPDGDQWVQAGIVSFGIFTCILPEAFARVSALVDFVLQYVPSEPSMAVAVDLGGGETAGVEFGNFR